MFFNTMMMASAEAIHQFLVESATGSFRSGDIPTEQWFDHPSEESNNFEGYAVAVSGDGLTAVIGAPYDSSQVTNGGRVTIWEYQSGTWTYVRPISLDTADRSIRDYLGWSVDISYDGSVIVVGAENSRHGGATGTRTGVAYVFERPSGGWSTLTASTAAGAKLRPTNSSVVQDFGYSVAVSGDGNTIVVGAPEADNVVSWRYGLVYLFEKPSGGWVDTYEDYKLYQYNDTTGDSLGTAVDISYDGSVVVAGMPYYDISNTSNNGAVIVFEKGNGWAEGTANFADYLLPKDLNSAQNNQFFGYSVAISADGNVIVVGAYNDPTNSGQSAAGSAYVHLRKTTGDLLWNTFGDAQLVQSFTISAGHTLGISVDVSNTGKVIVVGAQGFDDTDHTNVGAVFVYTEPTGGWTSGIDNGSGDPPLTEDYVITPSSGWNEQLYGHSVSISDDATKMITAAYKADHPYYLSNMSASEYDNIGAIYGYTHSPLLTNWGSSITGITGGFSGGAEIVNLERNSVCAVLDANGNRVDGYLWHAYRTGGGATGVDYIDIELLKGDVNTGQLESVYKHRCYEEDYARWKPNHVCDTGTSLVLTATENQYDNARVLVVKKITGETFRLNTTNTNFPAMVSSLQYSANNFWGDLFSCVYDPVYDDVILAYADPLTNFVNSTYHNQFVRFTNYNNTTGTFGQACTVSVGSSGFTRAVDANQAEGYIDRDPDTGYFVYSGLNQKCRRYQRTGATTFVAIDEFNKASNNLWQLIYQNDGTLYFRGENSSGSYNQETLYRH
jgi:hypothetical protein